MASNTVRVAVTAETEQFKRELQNSKRAVEELGKSSTKTGKQIKTIGGAVNKQTREIKQLEYQYYQLGQAQHTAFGQQLRKDIDDRIAQLQRMKKVQEDINNRINNVKAPSVPNIGSQLTQGISQLGENIGLPVQGISTALTSLMNPATMAAAAVAGVGYAIYDVAKAGNEFKETMDDFANRINLSAQQTEYFRDAAIDMSNKFGKSANEIVKQFQLLAEQAPGVEKDKEGFLNLADAANVLSVAFGDTVETSTNSLVTVLSKFNLSAKESSNIANVLAEASRNSGANIEYLGTVFDTAGTNAYRAGVSYKDLAAATSLLSSVEGDATKVGSGLNAMFIRLAKAEDKYNPEKVGLVRAVRNLKDAQLSVADMNKLVGARGAQVAARLMEQVDALEQQQKAMENTTAAYDIYNNECQDLDVMINRLKASLENMKLELADSGVIQTIIKLFNSWITHVTEVITYVGKLIREINGLEGGIDIVKAYNDYLGVMVQLWKGLLTVAQTTIAFIIKNMNMMVDAAKSAWNSLKSALSDLGWLEPIRKAVNGLINIIKKLFGGILDQWNDIRKALGLSPVGQTKGLGPQTTGSTSGKEFKEKMYEQTGGRAGTKPSSYTDSVDTSTTNKKTGKNGSGGAPKIDYDEKSIEWYDKQISALNDKLKKQNLSWEQQQSILEEINKLEKDRKEIQDKQTAYKQGLSTSLHDANKNQDKVDEALKLPETVSERYKVEPIEVDLVPKIQGSNEVAAELADNVQKRFNDFQDYYNIGAIDESRFLQEVESLQSILDDAGLTITLNPELKPSKLQKAVSQAGEILSSMGDAISSIASATEDEGLNVAGVIAQAIANVILGFATASAQEAKTGIWGWIAASVAGLATVAATVAQIHSISGYAQGGIVDAPTTVGDKNIIAVNGNEMILNRKQQSRLMNFIDHGQIYNNPNNNLTGTVTVNGDALRIALTNNLKKTGKKIS